VTGLNALPFRGIAIDRPYPPTGLSTREWIASVPVEFVRLDNLWLTQKGVEIPALLSCVDPYSIDTAPHAVAWDGELYLEDGHTRVVRAVLQFGQQIMPMRVFRRSA
jgi:hypothetical protein